MSTRPYYEGELWRNKVQMVRTRCFGALLPVVRWLGILKGSIIVICWLRYAYALLHRV